MSTLLLCVRAALLVVSFVGLCAGLSVRFQLDRCVAPFVAVSGIITVLMLAGMAGVLFPAVCVLYALGFAGVIYALAKRHTPPRSLILPLFALVAFLVFLVWRFYFCPLYFTDDLSHWGLVARHLLRYNRFPRSGDDYILFQSYPLGSACFIYYVARFIENAEGVYLVAQNFLLGMLYLPLFSLIQKRKNALYSIVFTLFFLMIHFFRYRTITTLTVDLEQGFFGIGIAAAIARYRNDARRALLSALPAMIAVAFLKNSGLFFSIVSAAIFLHVVKRGDLRRWPVALALFAAPVAAFLLWELHIRLSFSNALETKHAISFAAYGKALTEKGGDVIAQIALRQFRALFKITGAMVLVLSVMLPFSALLMYATHSLPAIRRRRIRIYFAQAFGIYFLWYFLIYLMYIFSMPLSEALSLKCLERYAGTGQSYLIGLTSILLLELVQSEGILPRAVRLTGCLCPLLVAVMILLTALPCGVKINRMFQRNTQLIPLRAALNDFRRDSGLGDGARILGFWPSGVYNSSSSPYVYYATKYEFETDDILMITCDARYPDQYYLGANDVNLPPESACDSADKAMLNIKDSKHGSHAYVLLRDVASYVKSVFNTVDAFLIYADYPDFEDRIAPILEAGNPNVCVYRTHLRMLK